MSNPLGNWIDLSAVSNLYIQTYVKGFVDMSGGNLILRNNNIYVNSGDLSLGGRLLTIGDASLGGNLYVGKKLTVNGDISANGNVAIYGNLMVQQLQNTNIINTSVNNYQLVVTEDISLNGRIIVSSDVSLAGRLFVTGATTASGLITANGGVTTGGSSVLTSAGTTTLTGATTATGLITANGGISTPTVNYSYSTLPTFTSTQIGYTNINTGSIGSFGPSATAFGTITIPAIGVWIIRLQANFGLGTNSAEIVLTSTYSLPSSTNISNAGQSSSLNSNGYTTNISSCFVFNNSTANNVISCSINPCGITNFGGSGNSYYHTIARIA